MLVIGSSRNQRIIIYHWQCYTEADPGEMTFDELLGGPRNWNLEKVGIKSAKQGFEHHIQSVGQGVPMLWSGPFSHRSVLHIHVGLTSLHLPPLTESACLCLVCPSVVCAYRLLN